MGEEYMGSIRSLDTSNFTSASNELKSAVTQFGDIKANIRSATTDLLAVWQGDARKAFEGKYDLLDSKLEDLEEYLIDFYESMLDAEIAYQDADSSVAKGIAGEE